MRLNFIKVPRVCPVATADVASTAVHTSDHADEEPCADGRYETESQAQNDEPGETHELDDEGFDEETLLVVPAFGTVRGYRHGISRLSGPKASTLVTDAHYINISTIECQYIRIITATYIRQNSQKML